MSYYTNAPAWEKEAWIQAYIDRRIEEGYEARGKRYNNKGNTGSVSVRAELRKRAKNKWAQKAKAGRKAKLSKAVEKVVEQYGETLRKLGDV